MRHGSSDSAASPRRSKGHLAAVARPAVTVVDLASASVPSTWTAYNDIPGVVYPGSSGTLQATVSVPAAGTLRILARRLVQAKARAVGRWPEGRDSARPSQSPGRRYPIRRAGAHAGEPPPGTHVQRGRLQPWQRWIAAGDRPARRQPRRLGPPCDLRQARQTRVRCAAGASTGSKPSRRRPGRRLVEGEKRWTSAQIRHICRVVGLVGCEHMFAVLEGTVDQALERAPGGVPARGALDL